MDTIEYKVLDFFKKALLNNKLTKFSFLTDFCKNEDDAFYLFLEFFEKFKIEKGNLNVDKYFYPKLKLLDLIKFKKINKESKPKITIEHLIKVVEKKEWFDPL